MAGPPLPPGPAAKPGSRRPGEGANSIPAADVGTITAALDQAADHKRDRAATCADSAHQSCRDGEFRLRAALAYDSVAARLLQASEAATSAADGPQPTPRGVPEDRTEPPASPETEAGQ